MSRIKKTLRNLIIIVALFCIFMITTGLRLTPIQAHKLSEKGIHYGPSKIVKVFNHGKYQHLLCKYDNWISCNTVDRTLFIFWAPGSQVTGVENNLDEALKYSESYSNRINIVYGIVNDENIEKVEVYTTEGNIIVNKDLYDNMFYFSWKSKGNTWGMKELRGYDKNGNQIYLFQRNR